MFNFKLGDIFNAHQGGFAQQTAISSRSLISRHITALRLRLLVDCQGKSTLQFIRHKTMGKQWYAAG
jgi:hypothetical protein